MGVVRPTGAECQAVSYTGKLGPATGIGHFNVCSQGATALDRMPSMPQRAEECLQKMQRYAKISKHCQNMPRYSTTKHWQDMPDIATNLCKDMPRIAKVCQDMLNMPKKSLRHFATENAKQMPGYAKILPRCCGDMPMYAKICEDIPKILPRHDIGYAMILARMP